MEFHLILLWILFVITFLLGYLIGSRHEVKLEPLKTSLHNALKTLDRSPVGVIHRPTAREQYLKDHPLEKEEQIAMTEELDKLNL